MPQQTATQEKQRICEEVCARQVKGFVAIMRMSLRRVRTNLAKWIDDHDDQKRVKSTNQRSDLDEAVAHLRRISGRATVLALLPEFADLTTDFAAVVRNFWRSCYERLDDLLQHLTPIEHASIARDISVLDKIIEEHDRLADYAINVSAQPSNELCLTGGLKAFIDKYSARVESQFTDEIPLDQIDVEEHFVDYVGISILLTRATNRSAPYSREAIKQYDRDDKDPPYGAERLPESEAKGTTRHQKLFRLSTTLKWIEDFQHKGNRVLTSIPKKVQLFSSDGSVVNTV